MYTIIYIHVQSQYIFENLDSENPMVYHYFFVKKTATPVWPVVVSDSVSAVGDRLTIVSTLMVC